jgi:hypothetical protein
MAYKTNVVPLTTAELEEIEQNLQLQKRLRAQQVAQDEADRRSHQVGGVFIQPNQEENADANHAATIQRIREQQETRDREDRLGLEAHRSLLSRRNKR